MTFPLAPMSAALRVLTWVLLALPCAMAYGAWVAPPPASTILYATTAFMVLVYASVWFVFRPTRFEVDSSALRIVWPVRTRVIPRELIEHASVIRADDFRSQYGMGMRVGAGGLWGGFGLLKTARETFSMWISRTDEFVIVRLRGERPLLVTPTNPARFVDALSRGVGA